MILTLKFVGRETERGQDQIALVEPARRQIAQHGAHKLVFELRAAQLAQYDIALLNAARLVVLALYAVGLALAYYSKWFCFHLFSLPTPLVVD